MSANEIVDKKLRESKLRKTTFRKLVLQNFVKNEGKALSSKDIEGLLHDPDRVTLYRTLKTFEEVGLIHQTVDTSGNSKFALCGSHCTEHKHHDHHAHFHCTNCDKTLCIEEINTSRPVLPEGFEVHQMHLILEGTCSDCRTK
ncbi:Fur family transcriptional regulator [Membranihabitans maritimus]|uniref:Fur family transcriptional regulator n=1 Tax=Membranihabitans maritimus TaxID=2904244 RepID=UPI001F010D77|nr:transcriptional repressor [Membranihabitans maritimus]